ncbi:MAG: hypothetical protein PHI18_00415, partial [bacterium]|nr:hypothetical protein [bacterium]
VQRLGRDFRMVGLMALQEADGDADDINRDVPGQAWSDSVRSDFEYANTYDVVFTADIDNDGRTETVRYTRNAAASTIQQTVWEWSRDSLGWAPPVTKTVATKVDYLMFGFVDRNEDRIPPSGYVVGAGYTLNAGERSQITAMEIIVVTKSDRQENENPQYVYLPDGTYFYDGYRREVHRFWVRGRNLSLGV